MSHTVLMFCRLILLDIVFYRENSHLFLVYDNLHTHKKHHLLALGRIHLPHNHQEYIFFYQSFVALLHLLDNKPIKKSSNFQKRD